MKRGVPVFGDPDWIRAAGVDKQRPSHRRAGVPWAHVRGPGPKDATCKYCLHLTSKGGASKTYYKCKMARITSGPGSDIRLKDPACKLFDTHASRAKVDPRDLPTEALCPYCKQWVDPKALDKLAPVKTWEMGRKKGKSYCPNCQKQFWWEVSYTYIDTQRGKE